MMPIIYFLIIVAWIILVSGYIFEEKNLLMFGSMLVIITGVDIASRGISDTVNFLTVSFAIIQLGIGFYTLVSTAYQTIQESE